LTGSVSYAPPHCGYLHLHIISRGIILSLSISAWSFDKIWSKIRMQ
jgi:hypothetical protein